MLDDAHQALLALPMSGDDNTVDRLIAEWRAVQYASDVPWSAHVRMLLRRTEELQQLEDLVNFCTAIFQSSMTIFLTYCDLFSDLLVMKQLYDQGKSITLLVALFAISACGQALSAWVLGQGVPIALSALLGLKPMIDEYRSCVSAPPLPDQVVDNVYMLFLTRMIQLGLDAIPQGIVQAIIYLSMDSNERTWLQLISITSTCCSIGSHAARADFSMDSNPRFHITEPWL